MSFRASPPPKTSSPRVRAVLAPFVLAIVLAGCGSSGSSTSTTVTATGSSLRVYLSDPPAVSANPALQDVVDAEDLAWTRYSPMIKSASVKIVFAKGSISDNARTAIKDDSVIAYLGEIQQGQSRQTVGITNAEDVLELSPTDTVVPVKHDYEDFSSYGRTFASLPLDLTTSPAALSKAFPAFTKTFTTDYGHAPSADAISGYDAVWVLCRVLESLGGSADNRAKITSGVIDTLKGNQGQASVPAFTIKK
jgi:hypothetical protein